MSNLNPYATRSYAASITQTILNSNSTDVSGTVENLINKFLTGIDNSGNYVSLVKTLNNQIAAYAPTSAIRLLLCLDDGSVVYDSGKGSVDLSKNPQNYSISELIATSSDLSKNTYNNFSNKMTISFGTFGSSVNMDVSNNALTSKATLTRGSAGGNFINENHMTRPEIITAVLSSTGSSVIKRYSSSLKNFLIYSAVRLGTQTEPLGVFRVSVPLSY
jgi:hypothetical protein